MMKKLEIVLLLLLPGVQSIGAAPASLSWLRDVGSMKASVAGNHLAENMGQKRRRQRRHNRKRGHVMPVEKTAPKPVKNAPPQQQQQPAHRNPWTERPLRPEQPEKPVNKPAKDNP
jgi:hypothetical protein